MYGIHSFEAFVLASIMLNLIPGPDTFYILGRSLAQGRAVGIASALGISGGAACHTLAAAVGLSAVIMATPSAFMAIKLLGAGYLAYLGLKLLSSAQSNMGGQTKMAGNGFVPTFRQGLITNLLNPKVALFFLAFLPQFIDPQSGNHFLSFSLLGLTFIFTGTVWGLVLAFGASAIHGKLQQKPGILRWFNKLTGFLFVGLGVKLVLDN